VKRRKPKFQPNEEPPPKTLAEARLDPPRRDPPTAVGTAKPKPPSDPYRPTRYGSGLTRMQRTSRGFLGSLLVVGGGAAMALGSSAILVVGAVMSLGGAVVTYRVLRAPSLFHSAKAHRRVERRRRRQQDTQ
jgi:hypothetical protein